MDPALWEMMEGDGDEEVEAIIRLRHPNRVPEGVRLVAQFGEIATCRLRRNAILNIRADEACASLKAPRLCVPEREIDVTGLEAVSPEGFPWLDDRRPRSERVTGRGVVIGIVDWGCDFAHPNFRDPGGSTRLLALWDQRQPRHGAPNRYGYGTVYTAEEINDALMTDDPYAVLGYHPADGDPDGSGSHGTHVMDIAAGNGRAKEPVGVAPEADLVFVHLATRGTEGLANLGDSVTVLEAVDFIAQIAGERPWVINLSIGRHGGPHDGTTLVEQGLDALLSAAPGRAICQSTGNYFGSRTHAAGQVRRGQELTLTWWTDAADLTPNELEIWYSGRDIFTIGMTPPDSDVTFRVPLGERRSIRIADQEVGRIYHRVHDPNNGDNHVDIFLHPAGPAGPWRVTLIGEEVVDGKFHAWVERDAACLHCQSRFDPEDADPSSTTGTLCNGFRTIAVGAYNSHSPGRELAPFSSAGPTRDGRRKPDLVAPGIQILAARSAPRDAEVDVPLHTRKSGTSMAAPHVTGTIALMFEAARRPLPVDETRRLLLGSTQSVSAPTEEAVRIGTGYLDIERAVDAARRITETEAVMNDAQADSQVEQSNNKLHEGETGEGVEPPDSSESDDELFDEAAEDVEIGDLFESDDEEVIDEAYLEDDEMVSEVYPDVESSGIRLVELADEAISAGEVSYASGALIKHVLTSSGITDPLNPLGAGGSPSPAVIFDAFAPGGIPGLRCHFEQFFEVVAEPGLPLNGPLHPGDLLVRRALGESNLGHVAFVATPQLWSVEQLPAVGLFPESYRPGWYVQVVEGGVRPHRRSDAFARRVLDANRRMPYDQLVLRPRFQGVLVPVSEQTVPSGQAEQDNLDSSFFADNQVLRQVLEGRRTLRSGSDGEHVARVQEALVSYGLMLPRFGVDGKFGDETRQAVKDFQRLNRLPETGSVDSVTLQKLDQEHGRIPLERRLCAVRHPDPCVGTLEVFCPQYLRADPDGDVVGTCTEEAQLGGQTPDSPGFHSRDTLWYKTTLPSNRCHGKFRVHHVAKDPSGQIFHTFPPHNPDPNWHRI